MTHTAVSIPSVTPADPRPASLARNPRLSRWLRIRPDGIVEARSGKVEIGQGILTALRQIVADELDVAPDAVRMLAADTAASPDEGVTSGSLSTQDSGNALRRACAEARAIYLAAAAAKLGVDASALTIADGVIRSPDGSTTSYAELADDALLERDAQGGARGKDPASRRCSGASAARIDLRDKFLGKSVYVHDLRLPGMLHGRVLRTASPGARLESLDEDALRGLEGDVRLVREAGFVGVVAAREDQALAALERLAHHARWREASNLPDEKALARWLDEQSAETTVIAERGTPSSARVARTLRARFMRPFLAHASIGPSCAVAQWKGDALQVWSHTQGIFNLRADLALVFGLSPERIRVTHLPGAGCYGHNGADDVALDAALLARGADGVPVRVQWSREEELGSAPFGPAMTVDLEADLDAGGEVVAWRGDVRGNGHTTRPGRAKTPTLLAAWHLGRGFEPLAAINMPLATGGGAERNAIPAYDFPAIRLRNHRVLAMPIRTSALRSLGAFANVFALESFVDEIAAARGEDPLAWRLRHLSDARARAVLDAVRRRSRWEAWQPAEGRGHGVAFARYKGNGAYCAAVAEVELTHQVRVTRLFLAVDVGFAVNPDGVAHQIEGGAVQATSWTLKEAVRFDRSRIMSTSWESYPILRFTEVPAVEVQVLQRETEPSVGAGEAAQGPVAGAIANAVCHAIGARVRELPLTPERIAAAV